MAHWMSQQAGSVRENPSHFGRGAKWANEKRESAGLSPFICAQRFHIATHESATAEWLFHQEKTTLQDTGKST